MEVTHPQIQAAADKVQEFAGGWFERRSSGRRIVLYGANGCGKTHMARRFSQWASRVAITAWEKHWKTSQVPRTYFLRWQRTCDDLSDDKSFAYLDQLAEDNRLLIIDDVGADSDRYKNQHSCDALCHLLSLCQGSVWLFVTTNEAPENWTMRWDYRTDSRLLRDSVVVDMSQVPDWSRL